RYLDFAVRFGRRHRFEIEQFAFHRSGEWSLLRQIRIRDDVFDVGVVVDTSFETHVTRLAYDYTFARNDKREIGVGIGLHVTDLSLNVQAELRPITSASAEVVVSRAPLPVIGLHGAYRPFPKWALEGQAQIFRLEAGGYKGALNHAVLAFEHNTFRHLGFGLALDFFEVKLDSTDPALLGAFHL